MQPLALLTLALTLLSSSAHAGNEDPQSFAGKPEMNGFKLSDYAGFEKNWKLVTVRFRKDTGELRFTYANPSAWQALQAGGKSYPEGAVIAKIGFATQEDPAFPSSAVPSGARRYQLMVRDKRFKETDGWGYALFDQKGLTFPENPRTQSIACAACHRLVPDRSYVFSQPLEFAPMPLADLAKQSSAMSGTPLVFKTVKVHTLPNNVRSLLPAAAKEVRRLEGAMRANLFQGTLDEIRPALTAEARAAKKPAALFSSDFKRYSIVYADEKSTHCGSSPEMVAVTSNVQLTGSQKFTFCAEEQKP